MKRLLSILFAAALLFSVSARALAAPQPLSEEAADWWNGIWYGWRVVTAAGGRCANQQGLRYDVIGTIEAMDEHGVIVLWDYDSYPECAFMTAIGSFHYDESGLGRFYSEGGFAFDEALKEKSLRAGVAWDLEHTVRIQGSFNDPEDAKNYLRYEIYLRPWGMDWEDLETSANDELPFSDMLPEHYEDWYLDRLAKGFDPLSEDETELQYSKRKKVLRLL